MPTPSDQIARGVNFILARDYVHHTAGPDVWARALARLTPAHRAVWELPLLPIGTYDFVAFKALVAAAAAERGATSDADLAAMYAYIADRSLNTLYKVFFRLANPAFVVGNFPKLWDRFFTAGRVQVPKTEREHATLDDCLAALGDARVFAVETNGSRRHDQVRYQAGDAFLFGRETSGLPGELVAGWPTDRRIHLPMIPGNRSLNLSNAVAVVVFEAWRQLGFTGS